MVHTRLMLPRRKTGRWHRPGGKITALDLVGRTLYVAQAQRQDGQYQIVRLERRELPAAEALDLNDPQATGRWMGLSLRQMGIHAGRVVLAAPRSKVLLRPIQLPAPGQAGELTSMVQFQMARELPFPAEEAQVDFTLQSHFDVSEPGGQMGGGPATEEVDGLTVKPKMEILAAAVRLEEIKKYRGILAAAGLKLAALGLRSYAAVKCLYPAGYRAETPHGILLVQLGGDELAIDVIFEGELVFSRSAPLEQAQQPEPAEARAIIDKAAVEVQRSLSTYMGMRGHEAVRGIVVAGDSGLEEQLARTLEKRLGLAGEVFVPSPLIRLPEKAQAWAGGAIGVIGLALAAGEHGGLPIDFVNERQGPARRDPRQTRMVLGAAVAVATLIMLFAVRSSMIKKHTQERDRVASQVKELRKLEAGYKNIIAQDGSVGKWVKAGESWLDHYALISAVLPPASEVYVRDLSTLADGKLRLGIQARSVETLDTISRQLRELGYDIQPLGITQSPDKFGYPAKTTLELAAPPGMKLTIPPPAPAAPKGKVEKVSSARRQGGLP